jgi:hypothetical protein
MATMFTPKAPIVSNPNWVDPNAPKPADSAGAPLEVPESMMPKMPSARVARMPTEMDPKSLAAAYRTRLAASRRSGRQSTILTDSDMGSSGRTLGS